METGKDSVACGLFRRGAKTIWQLRGRKGTVYARCVVRLGPTPPAFVAPEILDVLVTQFGLHLTGDVDTDLAALAAGKH